MAADTSPGSINENTTPAAGNSEWRFDGTLLRYRDRFGKSDGMNPVGGVVDEKAGIHQIYVRAGDGANQAGILSTIGRSIQAP